MSNWYTTENDGWYAPLQQKQGVAAAPEKKSRTWIKAVIAVLIVIGLITGSALLFPNRSPAAVSSAEAGWSRSWGSASRQAAMGPAMSRGKKARYRKRSSNRFVGAVFSRYTSSR